MNCTPLRELTKLATVICLTGALAVAAGCSREPDEDAAKKDIAAEKAAPAPQSAPEEPAPAEQAAPAAGSPAETPATAGKALEEPPTVGTAPPAAPEPAEPVSEALNETTPTEDAPLDTEGKPYKVVDGRIDQDTVEGWKIFRGIGTCATCHGPAGQGGVGSDLTEALKERVDYELFKQIVTNGKPGTMMKPFKTNKAVMDNIDRLYAYLKARADGVLGPGNLLKEPLGKGS
jgi:mono/diheme cytochrome c family protein